MISVHGIQIYPAYPQLAKSAQLSPRLMRPDNEILIFAGDEQLLSLQASASRRLGLKKARDFHV